MGIILTISFNENKHDDSNEEDNAISFILQNQTNKTNKHGKQQEKRVHARK